ncbi:UPF0158 family protein [Robertmurraya sp.]|uniref:UPF0158 family protein n=1 Tax=Robertmurraya sp. TaxID=2837525 RepID=UPI0037042BD0
MINKKPVKLDDLVGEIEIQINDTFTYINTQTGEVITLSEEEIRAVEDEKPIENFPDWQKVNIEKAIEILEDEDGVYLDFTLRNEYHEYEIIEEFIGTVIEEEIREALYEAIQGRGAFRRFKDGIIEHGVEKEWYEYKDKKIKELVIEWCKEHDITIEE